MTTKELSIQQSISVVQTILVYEMNACISLCLSFEGFRNLLAWYSFSKMLCDLSDKMPRIEYLDLDMVSSPMEPKILKPEFIDNSVPYAIARPMAANRIYQEHL